MRVVIPPTTNSRLSTVPGGAGYSEGRGKEWAHLNPRICLFPARSQIVERTDALPL